ncbi:MAG: hypothetical protein U0T73_11690 [Chitinophagales bacterium]
MKNNQIILVAGFILGFIVVPFVLPDNIRDFINSVKVKGINSVAVNPPRQPPPCLNKPSSTSTVIIYRKSSSSTVGLEAAKVIVQQVISETEFTDVTFANTDVQGKIEFQNLTIAKDRQRQRLLAISPDGTDTTRINLVSCTGISEIKIPVNAP